MNDIADTTEIPTMDAGIILLLVTHPDLIAPIIETEVEENN